MVRKSVENLPLIGVAPPFSLAQGLKGQGSQFLLRFSTVTPLFWREVRPLSLSSKEYAYCFLHYPLR